LPNTRPEHLPDYLTPPLHEVVIGVQFSPPKEYHQIRAGEVWALYKREFPKVQEQPALEPAFETFGIPSTPKPRVNLITGASHDRYWFVADEGDELIQFQQDRLLHNWRRVGDQTNAYPRFEKMIERFSEEIRSLEKYFASLSSEALAITQCEITYLNHIRIETWPPKLDDWFQGLSLAGTSIDDANIGFRQIIRDDNQQPIGRITHEITAGLTREGVRILILNLTVRGAPEGPDIESALRFLKNGRELIVNRFTEITTKKAHSIWGRKA